MLGQVYEKLAQSAQGQKLRNHLGGVTITQVADDDGLKQKVKVEMVQNGQIPDLFCNRVNGLDMEMLGREVKWATGQREGNGL